MTMASVQSNKGDLMYHNLQEQKYDDNMIYNLVNSGKKKSISNIFTTREEDGKVYPEIVWYLISTYIEPSDIDCFAAINKTAYSVTRRDLFWYSLYDRYCKESKRLPICLQIDETNRYSLKSSALRQRVIRALYYTYKPFVEVANDFERKDPFVLLNKECNNIWFDKGRSSWKIYMQFKKQNKSNVTAEDKNSALCDLEDYVVLLIHTKEVRYVLPLMGMTLDTFCVSYKYPGFKLEMGFKGPPETYLNFETLHTVVLDPVMKWNIYNWWHPKYPKSNGYWGFLLEHAGVNHKMY